MADKDNKNLYVMQTADWNPSRLFILLHNKRRKVCVDAKGKPLPNAIERTIF